MLIKEQGPYSTGCLLKPLEQGVDRNRGHLGFLVMEYNGLERECQLPSQCWVESTAPGSGGCFAAYWLWGLKQVT